MSANRHFIISKPNGSHSVYLSPSGFDHPIWQKDINEATVFHERLTAEKAAHTHGGSVEPFEG